MQSLGVGRRREALLRLHANSIAIKYSVFRTPNSVGVETRTTGASFRFRGTYNSHFYLRNMQ
jgi:hypothetical protein